MKERARGFVLHIPAWAIALAAGALAALAHPPFGFLPGLLAYGVLLHGLDRVRPERPLRSAFWRAWLFGAAYFGIGVWWVAEAFLVDVEAHGWMAPFAVIILAGGVAMFWGAAGALYRLIRPQGPSRVLVFAGCFTLLEWARGVLGFPWNLPGETWAAGSAPSQFASVVGAYGLTWITLAITAAPMLLRDGPRRRDVQIAVGAAAAALVLLYGYGLVRLANAPADGDKGALVRIVQADVPQAAKYDEAHFTNIVRRYVALTGQAAPVRPDIVIWPEGALPVSPSEYLAEGTWTRTAIAGALAEGQTLILGGYRYLGGRDDPRVANSLFVFQKRGEALVPTGIYDKHHLVPFGEFTPARGLLEKLGVTKLVQVNGDFTPGPRPRPLAHAGIAAFQPLICYESLFPGITRRGVRISGERPAWIVNISNDAWFGRTSGPWQHLNLAAYRAIEEGLPMVRATPTGVSALINSYGIVASNGRAPPGEPRVLDVRLPAAAAVTPYEIIGDFALWMMGLLSFLLPLRHFVMRAQFKRDSTVRLRN